MIASHARVFGTTEKPYSVVYCQDFRGVRFQLTQFNVEREPVGLQLAFPIASCGNESTDDYFADISLEVGGTVVQNVRVPRETHSNAGRVLLVSGYSEEFESRVF